METRIKNLLDAVLGADDIVPKPVPVKYDRADLLEPDPVMHALRFKEYVAKQTVLTDYDIRLVGHLRFDGSFCADLFHRSGHKRWAEVASEFYLKMYKDIATFEWEHSTIDYEMLLKLGIDGLRDKIAESMKNHADDREKTDFLRALSIICDGIDLWSERLAEGCEAAAESSEPERAAELRKTAEICRLVPKRPARNFREAMQVIAECYWFLPDSIGCIDRYLYDFYSAGIADGSLTRGEAKSLLQELFILIKSHVCNNFSNADKGGEAHFAIGGYNENMEDSWNELSELVLESLMELPLVCPQISIRWTKKMPFEVLRHVLDCERKDKGKRIALISDETRLYAYTKLLGYDLKDAVRYTTVGCNETAFPGSVDMTGMNANIALSVTRMIYEDTERFSACRSFDEVFALFSEHLESVLDEIIEIQDKFNYARAKDNNVLSSLFMQGAIESATSVTRGGSKFSFAAMGTCGLISVIDSMILIKQLVFDEKIVTLQRLYEVLKSDWAEDEELHNYVLRNGGFFGNNDPRSNEIAQLITRTCKNILSDRRDMFGNKLLMGAMDGYNPHSSWFGAVTPATPDGRHSGDPFMVGVGQTNGKDRKGLTSLLLSVAHMDPEHILTASLVFNVNLDEPLIRDDRNFEKTARMIETYFMEGGTQLQLNYVSRETLLDAKKCPDKYGSLRVRVSGFSATFTRLNPLMQDQVIARTEIKG